MHDRLVEVSIALTGQQTSLPSLLLTDGLSGNSFLQLPAMTLPIICKKLYSKALLLIGLCFFAHPLMKSRMIVQVAVLFQIF